MTFQCPRCGFTSEQPKATVMAHACPKKRWQQQEMKPVEAAKENA